MGKKILWIAVLAALSLLLTASPVLANTFNNPGCSPGNVPPACIDLTVSLGYFIIMVTDGPAQAFLAANHVAGYDPATNIFISPLLYDSSTAIGRSPTFTDTGSQPSQTVGTGGAQLTGITDASFVPGGIPAGFTSTGNDAVYTNLQSLDLAGGGYSAVAGSAAAGTAVASSTDLGKVVANQSGAGNDFPAKSFFDVFTDISIPSLGTAHNTLANPVIPKSTLPAGSQLPPKVVYFFTGQSGLVPVVFDSSNPGLGIVAGDTLGNFMLVPYGVGYSNSATDMMGFNQMVAQTVQQDAFNANSNPNGFTSQEQQFLIAALTPEPSTLVLLSVGLALIARKALVSSKRV